MNTLLEGDGTDAFYNFRRDLVLQAVRSSDNVRKLIWLANELYNPAGLAELVAAI